MIRVLCHNCCPSIPEGMLSIEADFNLSEEYSCRLIDHHKKYCGKEEVMEHFKDMLFGLRDRLREDRNFAVDIYRALCNMQWQNKKDPENIYGCSWRYAGGLVADIRDLGEDYLDFYCSGGEGTVSKEVNKIFNKAGWKQLPYKDINGDESD